MIIERYEEIEEGIKSHLYARFTITANMKGFKEFVAITKTKWDRNINFFYEYKTGKPKDYITECILCDESEGYEKLKGLGRLLEFLDNKEINCKVTYNISLVDANRSFVRELIIEELDA